MLSVKSRSPPHWKSLLHILAYIKGTLDYYITYSKDAGCLTEPVGYVDANYREDLDMHRSTSRYVFMMARGLVSWSSKH